MDSQFAVIPAAIGLMLGPPILASVMLATSKRARANSLAFIVGIVLGSTIGMIVAYFAATLIEVATDDMDQGDNILPYLVVALLVFLVIKTFLGRKTAEPPKWMSTLQEAEPKFAFKIGALLSMLTPANVIILFSAGAYLVDNDLPFRSSFILIAVTTLIAAIPIIT